MKAKDSAALSTKTMKSNNYLNRIRTIKQHFIKKSQSSGNSLSNLSRLNSGTAGVRSTMTTSSSRTRIGRK